MRLVDRWVGVPVCAALSVWRRVADLIGGGSGEAGPVRRILFVKLAEQGSTVLAYAALRRAAAMVGRENVFFVCFQENRFILDILEVLPEENVIAIRTGGLVQIVRGALAAVRRMRAEGIDAAIDMEFFARSSAAMTYLSGARRRVGFHAFAGEASYRGDLMTHRLSFNPHPHTTETFWTMVEALTLEPAVLPAYDREAAKAEDPPAMFRPTEDELRGVREILHREAGGRAIGRLVLLNANCSDMLPIRRWPTDRYLELARRVLDRYPDVFVALTGAPDEQIPAERLVREIGSDRCLCMAGRTMLRQLLVLYTLSEVLVTNDSGPAHFATLTPIDVITLFGPETPKLFAARTPRNHVHWSGVPCSPCVSAYNDRLSPCRNNICLQRIGVDEVFETLCSVLEQRQGVGVHKE